MYSPKILPILVHRTKDSKRAWAWADITGWCLKTSSVNKDKEYWREGIDPASPLLCNCKPALQCHNNHTVISVRLWVAGQSDGNASQDGLSFL